MAIRDQNIVCLASQDFDDLWTRKQRWMTRLAETNRVFWVDLQLHAATYLRQFGSSRRRSPGTVRHIGKRMWVYTPPVTIPGYQMSVNLCRVHNAILHRALRTQLHRYGFTRNILWLYTPYNAFQIGRLNDTFRVYECVDDFSSARGLIRSEVVEHLESATIRRSDAIIVTSDTLRRKFKNNAPRLLVSPNAADFDHFRRAGDENLPVPDELRDINGPVIGFLGSVAYWVDIDLITVLARARPEWTFVLVGPVRTPLGVLAGLPNVRIIGRRPYESLPGYLKRFDVCLNPYKPDAVAAGASPLKLYEYLATGKPVVSSDMPEARRFPTVVMVAGTPAEMMICIDRALREDRPERRACQLQIAAKNSWTVRFAEVEDWISPVVMMHDKRKPLVAGRTNGRVPIMASLWSDVERE
jgi:glycosyltransferase involved in cell wall biosynthesis